MLTLRTVACQIEPTATTAVGNHPDDYRKGSSIWHIPHFPLVTHTPSANQN